MPHSTLWKATSSVARNCQQSKNPVPIQWCKKMVWSAKTRCEFFPVKKQSLNDGIYKVMRLKLIHFRLTISWLNDILVKSQFLGSWHNRATGPTAKIFRYLNPIPTRGGQILPYIAEIAQKNSCGYIII